MLRLVLSILWPSFLVSIVAEGFFFSAFDPHELQVAARNHVEVSALAAYTLGFFFFWAFCSIASMLTYYLMHAPEDRQQPF